MLKIFHAAGETEQFPVCRFEHETGSLDALLSVPFFYR